MNLPSIRQATTQDVAAIANLFSSSPFVHRHLDWKTVVEWIPESPFLLYEIENQLFGILACPPDPQDISWIRCFACSAKPDPQAIFHSLLDCVKLKHLLNTEYLYGIGLFGWFEALMKSESFTLVQSVVVLEQKIKQGHSTKSSQFFEVRIMESSDIPEVAKIDLEAFEPVWALSAETLASAFTQAEHASVAVVSGTIIGYEISTANDFSAHLARVAVHPQFQKRGIASNLISGMLDYFYRKGIRQISVNTQNDNKPSLTLYARLGFRKTGESYPIYRFKL
jgi:ribosomal protein S18 acetylase RimI-like enzyme